MPAIKRLIDARGNRPQRAIAQEMNAKGFMTIDSADVSRWENGMIPRGAKLRAYAATLGMTTDEIIDIYEGIPDQGNAAQDRDGD